MNLLIPFASGNRTSTRVRWRKYFPFKLFRTFTRKITRGLSLRMVFSLVFQDTLLLAVAQGPHHHPPNPWISWGRPPHQQQRGRAHHERTPRHRGGHQAHQQRVMCQQCGKADHFPADCVITMPAPALQYTAPFSGARPAQYGTGAHATQQYSTGAHVAQYGTHPLTTWTSNDSDNQSTHSAYGPPSNQASFAPAQPMPPPPPGSVGSPPPPAPPSDSDWSFSSGPSQALQAQYMPPGEFSSSGLTDG